MTRPEAGGLDRRGRLIVLGICSFSLFMTYLDSTILNVALPTIQRAFGAGVTGLQWVVDAYMLVLASLVLVAGSTGDRIGRRRVFTVGLVTFAAGSLLCSLAPNLDALIAFRALQAVGGCMLTPVSLSIVRTTFTDPAERAKAFGVWSAVFGLATACGPVVGGTLVDLVGWRSIFWVNVPVGLGAALLTRRFIPESRAPDGRRLDAAGQALVVTVLACLTYGIIEGPTAGWTSPTILAPLAAALGGGVAFVVVESRHPEPLLAVRFFRSPPFAGANSIAVLSFTVLAGFLFVNTLYLQEVRGDSALAAGLATLPVTVLIVLTAPLAGRLVARRGPQLPLAGAGLLLAAGCALLLRAGPHTPYGELAAAYVLLGVGFGVVNPPITNTAVTSMPPAQAGVASAVASASRQLGNVLGVAVMGALLTSQLRALLPGRLAPLHLPPGTAHELARRAGGAGGSLASASEEVRAAFDAAFSGATHTPWLLGTACGLACAALGMLTAGRRARDRARTVYADPDPGTRPAAAPRPPAGAGAAVRPPGRPGGRP